MDQYAVVGNPISHSKSPLIHALFAKQCGQELEYSKLESPLNEFLALVNDFFYGSDSILKQRSRGLGKGLNVTVPFKEQAWSLCAHLSDGAKLAGAVNTLYLNEKGEVCGENTDGIGLVRDIKNQGVSFKEKKILIIGAGGAVRGVLQPILKEIPGKVVLTNRTLSKAEALVSIFSGLGNISSSGFDQLNDSFDIIINGTTIELDNVSLDGTISQINNSDAVGVEADTVQRLRIDSLGEDKTISLEHFVADVAGITINVEDNEASLGRFGISHCSINISS